MAQPPRWGLYGFEIDSNDFQSGSQISGVGLPSFVGEHYLIVARRYDGRKSQVVPRFSSTVGHERFFDPELRRGGMVAVGSAANRLGGIKIEARQMDFQRLMRSTLKTDIRRGRQLTSNANRIF